jgi:hypothetical protein
MLESEILFIRRWKMPSPHKVTLEDPEIKFSEQKSFEQ